MDVTWYGHSCFRITERGKTTVITDPYGEDFGIAPTGPMKADIVTVSHQAPGHSDLEVVKGEPYLLGGPGEYEIGGVFVTGIPLHDAENERYNVGYLLNYDGLTVLHMGDLAHVPEQTVVEGLGQVNVLLLPVGGGHALRGPQAAEVVSLIEPNYIVPMHYAIPGLQLELEPVDQFLKAMGVSSPADEEVLRVTSSSLPEQPQVILLQPQI